MGSLLKMSPIGYALLSGSIVLQIGLILLFVFGVLPLGTADFAFFFFVSILATMYRPGWVFLLLLSVLPLEIINLAPTTFGIDIRPYQFLEASMFIGLLCRGLLKKTLPPFPRLGFGDAFLFAIPAGAFLATFVSDTPEVSFKLAVVLSSFWGIFFLARVYIQSQDDVRRVFPFVLASGVVTLGFGLFQAIRSTFSLDAFEVMPGRPNGLFPEPDWLGMYVVFFGATLLALGAWLSGHPRSVQDRLSRMYSGAVFLLLNTLLFIVLLLTVSRSAWLGMAVSFAIFSVVTLSVQRSIGFFRVFVANIGGALAFALILVVSIPLTTFDLSGRAGSIASGEQEITISCENSPAGIPLLIRDISELSKNNCRHIDIEEIEDERAAGRSITTVLRPDPSVEIRRDIYGISLEKIRKHPYTGIGWGSISAVLGTDERGAGLNASNIFFEVWLGSGLIGVLGLVLFLGLVLYRFLRHVWKSEEERALTGDTILAIFFLSVIPGIIVFDLFNAGILIGFLWVLFAAALVRLGKDDAAEGR